MTSFGHAARDGRGKFREAAAAAPHTRATPTTLPLPTLRAAAATTTTATAPVQLVTSIQSRPLAANPTHPLLWSTGPGSTSSSSGGATASAQSASGGLVTRLPRTGSSASTTSSLRGSLDGHSHHHHNAPRGVSHSGTTAHTLEPHKPDKGRTTASMRAPQPDGPPPQPPSSSVSTAGKADRTKKATAVNYNALFHQQQQQQQEPPSSSSASPSPAPPSPSTVVATAPFSKSSPPPLPAQAEALAPSAGAVAGPLPPEVRRLIAQSCGGATASDALSQEAAEQQARRLISTGRRVKVYREELAAAEEERRDWAAATEQRSLVRSVLVNEVEDLNARIQALLQERALCEAQLRDEDEAAARETRQLAEAEERVSVLRRTIDGIVEETVVPRLMLQELVPSLLIENYI